MKSRKEFIDALECDATDATATSASIEGSGRDPEGMRSAIDAIEVKRTKSGKPKGMKVAETEKSTNKLP